jgi:single-strand DNA-binding protein
VNSGDAFISLTGYIATQPTLRTTRSGVPSLSMRVGWTPRWLDRESGEWTDGPSSFATVQCYRRLAQNAAMSLRTGDAVQVRGKVSVREYEGRNGEKMINVDIDATSIGHDLCRGVAGFSRARQSTSPTAAELDAGGDGQVPAGELDPDGPADALTADGLAPDALSDDSPEPTPGSLEPVSAPF